MNTMFETLTIEQQIVISLSMLMTFGGGFLLNELIQRNKQRRQKQVLRKEFANLKPMLKKLEIQQGTPDESFVGAVARAYEHYN